MISLLVISKFLSGYLNI